MFSAIPIALLAGAVFLFVFWLFAKEGIDSKALLAVCFLTMLQSVTMLAYATSIQDQDPINEVELVFYGLAAILALYGVYLLWRGTIVFAAVTGLFSAASWFAAGSVIGGNNPVSALKGSVLVFTVIGLLTAGIKDAKEKKDYKLIFVSIFIIAVGILLTFLDLDSKSM